MSSLRTLFYITLIVAAELTAFTLLQYSVDSPKRAALNITLSILLFGLVVPLAFRETLKGNKIAIANLYWIIASAIGSIALGYILFNQTLTSKEYIAVGVLIAVTMYQVFG
jgi:multidrug transporter EmrE-like cation transporter